MVINENTLLKLMEKAYKGGGYHLAVSREPFHGCFMIANYGYSWACVIKVPMKKGGAPTDQS